MVLHLTLLIAVSPVHVAADGLRLERQLAGTAPARATPGPPASREPALELRLARRLAQASSPDTPATPTPAPTPARTPVTVGEVYVDSVLDDSPVPEVSAETATEAGDDSLLGPGRSRLGIDWTWLHERDAGRISREYGMAASWRRETLEYGFLSAEIAGRLTDDGGVGNDDGGGRFSLRQEDFVLDGEWLSDSTLGDQVVTADPLLTRSFRFNLPSSYLRGGGLRLHDDVQELRVQAGALGNLRGDRLLTYESTGATLAGIGYTRDFSPRFRGALQYWSLQDDPDRDDHQSLAAALSFRYGEAGRVQVRTLRDSGGKSGVWLDGDHQAGTWHHRYGLFRFERDLRWLDDGIADDRTGLYWRSDLRSARYDLSGGLDLTETNLDGAPDRAGIVTASTFLRGSWLARRDTRLGASVDLRATRDGRGAPVNEQNRTDLSAFVSRRWSLGTSRLQADTTLTRGAAVHDNRYELSLDHAWNLSRARLSTRLRTARERGTGGDNDQVSLGALAGFDLGRDLSFTGDATASLVSGEQQHSRTLRLGVGLVWQLSRQWRLDLNQDVVDRRTRSGGVTDNETSVEIFARLRWSETSGREAAVLGRRGDLPGSGRIAGVVFFDENRDGLRSPGEEVVPGAGVLLDGRRAEARTDSNGRYEFWPVFTGAHDLRLRTEELPLPWGLLDDSPVQITLGARETVTVDFPLVRLDE